MLVIHRLKDGGRSFEQGVMEGTSRRFSGDIVAMAERWVETRCSTLRGSNLNGAFETGVDGGSGLPVRETYLARFRRWRHS